MTIHAFDETTNSSVKWVALPLEFVDWMAANCEGILIQHLRTIDPYASVLIPDGVTGAAVAEFGRVRRQLCGSRLSDVPETVDLFGEYGVSGALATIDQLLESSNSLDSIPVGL